MTSDEPMPPRMTMLRAPMSMADADVRDDVTRAAPCDDDSLDSAARLRRVVHEAVAAVRGARAVRLATAGQACTE